MNTNNDPAKKIIVALDVDTKEKALSLVEQLKESDTFKVGLKLFTANGPSLINDILNLGKNVFLDLKLHDIPNTVAGAVQAGTKHGVRMMSLHAAGGREMIAKAVSAAKETSVELGIEEPVMLAVTVLTSMKDEQLRDIGIPSPTEDQVLRLAHIAGDTGAHGIVCSPLEIELIRKELGEKIVIVAPGIRPSWAAAQDQKRIMTPGQALQKGADYLVIGRPIIANPHPREAFQKILQELKESE